MKIIPIYFIASIIEIPLKNFSLALHAIEK